MNFKPYIFEIRNEEKLEIGEAKLISHKQYEEIALKLNEIGRMFGGWRNSLNNPQKKNRRL